MVAESRATRRVLLYSHDSYGLGHLRRSILLAEAIAGLPEVGSVLIATGSPRAQAFPLPHGVDTVKLPAVTKSGGMYTARSLDLPMDEITEVRSRIIAATVESFAPDLILVDHAPLGLGGELRPVLDSFTAAADRPAVLLGLRDVIDSAERVHEEWDRTGVWASLADYYDRVLVYGDPRLPTTAVELAMASRIPIPVEHVGYVVRPRGEPARPAGDLPMVLVTVGGGGDGQELLRAYAAVLRDYGSAAPFRSVVVTGPLMSTRRRAAVADELGSTGAPLDVMAFTDNHERLVADATAVVAMGGYNTTCEILVAGVPALVFPRRAPRVEQLLRARRLAAIGALEVEEGDELSTARLRGFLDGALARGRTRISVPLSFAGTARVARTVSEVLGDRRAGASGPRNRTAGPPPQRVGYVLKKFPRLSETFILNELLGLERLGADLEIFSLLPPDPEPRHDALADLRAPVSVAPGATGSSVDHMLRAVEHAAGPRALERVTEFLTHLPPGRDRRVLAKGMWLAGEVRARGVSHLHAHFLTVAAHTAYIAHIVTGVPFSVTAHAKDVYRHGVDRWIFAEIAGSSAALVTVCEANHRFITETFSVHPARVQVIPNGLPLAALPEGGERDPSLVLAVGRLVEKKGFDVLVEACRSMRDAGRTFRCLIIGDGELRAGLADQIREAGLGTRVEMLGAVPSDVVLGLMARARVLVAPCVTGSDGNQDALPTVILEAMALGLPVVTTAVGGITEMVEHGREGIIVPERDPVALAAAVGGLLDDDARWRAMSAAGPGTVRDRFDRETTIRRLAAVLGLDDRGALMPSVSVTAASAAGGSVRA